MSEKSIKTVGVIASIATILATCIAIIALIPAFGQWLNPRSPIATPGLPVSKQPITVQPTSTELITTQALSTEPITTQPLDAPKILWTAECDPRASTDYCKIGSSLAVLDRFYAVIDSVNGTLTYGVPHSEQDLAMYSVVIVDFCSGTGNDSVVMKNSITAIKQYIQSGGSAFVLGGNWCGDGEHMTSWYATQVTQDFGITFTSDDDSDNTWADSILPHPVTADIEKIYAFRHAYLTASSPSQTIVKINGKPIMAVYDDAGTFVALAEDGFQWGTVSNNEVTASDNFDLWLNAIKWLINQSQTKL